MASNPSFKRAVLVGMGVVGAALVLDGILMPFLSHEMTTIPVHHLLHTGMALGAGLLAMALAARLPQRERERTWWVIPAVLAPAASLFLMWPSEYAALMSHPWLHALDHLGIALCGILSIYAAQAYVRGLGWPMLVLVVAMNAAAAGGFGVSPGLVNPSALQASAASSGASAAVAGGSPVSGSALCVAPDPSPAGFREKPAAASGAQPGPNSR